MPLLERVTITLPADLVREIDRQENNRSRFLQEAARRELHRRRREQLRRSLASPHSEATEVEESGFGEWATSLPDEDATGLVDGHMGIDVRWVPGEGWTEGST